MRPIDADELLTAFPYDDEEPTLTISCVRMTIKRMPTIVAESVVRCKDCRYYDAENHNCLDEMAYARIWNEDDYCSFAERRENETN